MPVADRPPPAQPAVGGNMYMYLQIVLPHAFVHGDGLGVRYVSQQYIDKEVQDIGIAQLQWKKIKMYMPLCHSDKPAVGGDAAVG